MWKQSERSLANNCKFVTLLATWEMNGRNQRKECEATFDKMDKENKGYITKEELKKFLQSIGESMPDNDFERFLADSEIVDEEGNITRESFLEMFD